MNILKTVGLTKRFGGLEAVKEVAFTLKEGEIVGIIGPNGAGKTTMIHLISGIHMPSEGYIYLNDRDISFLPAHERNRIGIGRTFQVIHPLHNLNVLENIMVGFLFSQEKTKREAKALAEQLCASLELPGIERPVSKLNILELKKMEIAHALATGPKFLFLDEIMAGLNSDETSEIIEMIQRITKERKLGIGVVEHVMGVIKALTHRVIVLDAGRIIASGIYEEVSKDQQVIAAYLGGGA